MNILSIIILSLVLSFIVFTLVATWYVVILAMTRRSTLKLAVNPVRQVLNTTEIRCFFIN